MKLRLPFGIPLGELIFGGFFAALGAIALAAFTREQATAALCMVAILWWFGWPWYLRRRDHRLTILHGLAASSPKGFEEAVAALFSERGYEQVRPSHSDPSEIRCLDRAGRSVLVRAKRPPAGRRIGSKELKPFIREVRAHHDADRGIFVTTATFTPTAFALARRSGIGLMEGRQLITAMASEDHDHHTFDRQLHEWQDPAWNAARSIRVIVLLVLLAMGGALWIGPTLRVLHTSGS